MSEAVAAPCGTAAPDWVLVVATSDGDGVGEAGCGITACCCGCWLVWPESAAMRADAPPGSAEADCVLWAGLADAVFVFTGFAGSMVAAAGVLADAFASGVIAACCGGGGVAGAGATGTEAGWLLAIVTGLEPEKL